MAKDYERPLLWRQLLYLRWFNPSWTARSLAETLSENYLGDTNFTELGQREVRGDSPRLLINTTLYNDGRRFLLSTLPRNDSQFDLIGKLEQSPQAITLQKPAMDLMPWTPGTTVDRGDVLQILGAKRDLERAVKGLGYVDRPTEKTDVVFMRCFRSPGFFWQSPRYGS